MNQDLKDPAMTSRASDAHSPDVATPSVSVIICAYTLDRWTSLQEAIASCSNQTRQPDEVIVVIDYNDEKRIETLVSLLNF